MSSCRATNAKEAASQGATQDYEVPESDFRILARVLGREPSRDERRLYVETLTDALPA